MRPSLTVTPLLLVAIAGCSAELVPVSDPPSVRPNASAAASAAPSPTAAPGPTLLAAEPVWPDQTGFGAAKIALIDARIRAVRDVVDARVDELGDYESVDP
jgi:hypothetical protein